MFQTKLLKKKLRKYLGGMVFPFKTLHCIATHYNVRNRSLLPGCPESSANPLRGGHTDRQRQRQHQIGSIGMYCDT